MNQSQNPKILSWTVSSQKRIFSSDMPMPDLLSLSGLRNEPISFGLAYRTDAQKGNGGRQPDTPLTVLVSCDTLPVSVQKVCSVPFAASECEDATPYTVGPCPDILIERQPCPEILHLEEDRQLPYYEKDEKQLINASCIATQGLLITANAQGETVSAGDHTVSIRILSLMTGEVVGSHSVTLHIVDALLPKNDLIYTNWFHYDCMADSHGVAVWSDAFFEILAKYIKNATLHGMTALLTPAFTPALDTPIGTERQNVQLVGVKKGVGGYTFDFTLLTRFITVARENGIRYFEHCHLFSQWGAKCAINIYGEEGGKTVRLFGFDTPATDPEYVRFLTQYLTEFMQLAKNLGIEKDLLIHISDEPKEEEKDSYAAALDTVKNLVAGTRHGDALSDYAFYRHGLVDMPIVRARRADDFDEKCDNMMLYYTGGEGESISNRLLISAPWKTRILGVHMFRYRAVGFLHWGYNYTYGRMSQGLFNPTIEPSFYKNIPGVTYLVYPDPIYTLFPSLREVQMRDAVNDFRALKLLSEKIGYDATLALCEEELGCKIDAFTIPESGEKMLSLRDRINREIEKQLNV